MVAYVPVLGPRVLIVLGTSMAWSRGILRGFVPFALEEGWNLLHYHPNMNLDWLARMWKPQVVLLGPEMSGPWPQSLRSAVGISINADRTAEGIASVCLDEEEIAKVALAHLLSKGLTNVTTFRFDEAAFAAARERAFHDTARVSGARLIDGWWKPGTEPSRNDEDPAAMVSWLTGLPRPCGVFACCDTWAGVVARYALAAELRVPEDVSIVGVDNDAIQCELTAPPLSSVMVPWQNLGRQAGQWVRQALAGQAIAGKRVVMSPGHVVTRRSSDALAIEDPLVGRAVAWIHKHSGRPLTVPEVARASATSRRRLERRFHAVLGRTVVQEIRRIRVETAKRLLAATRHDLAQIAKLCGFTSAALLSVAFRREVGVPPGAYRRRLKGTPPDHD